MMAQERAHSKSLSSQLLVSRHPEAEEVQCHLEDVVELSQVAQSSNHLQALAPALALRKRPLCQSPGSPLDLEPRPQKARP